MTEKTADNFLYTIVGSVFIIFDEDNMKTSIIKLDQLEVSSISGGKFCHTVVTVKDPKEFKKSYSVTQLAPGVCHLSLFATIRTGKGESLTCKCRDEYLEDSIIIKKLELNSNEAGF